ncbi:RimK-like ATPgrasp N-terminal domain-containing protein [Desulfovibrio aminophilus]|uniref:RimK family protein n=1 Tax=Desulfovibrio aminophilus TaxID=81425 RepID=UPI0033974FF3
MILTVIENPEDCPLTLSGIEPVAARTYLSDASFSSLKGAKVFNFCQSYRYQSLGYYVSLLAEARKHKPVPSVTTIQDLKSMGIISLASDELDELIVKLLDGRALRKFSLNIYFGRTQKKGLEPLASRLFKFFPAPFLRADFNHSCADWYLQNVSPLSMKDIPKKELPFASEVASEYLAGKKLVIPKRSPAPYDLAILQDPAEKRPPSDQKALKRFAKAAESLGMGVEFITRDDSRRLSEFDALFIRETTNVDHHTYRMARKAAEEGLVVVDDPESILRCSNKVFLAELLGRHKVATPRTIIVHSRNVEQVLQDFGLPCILKQPDSSFSQGVVMACDREGLMEGAKAMLKRSDLVIAQEYLPSDYDWRVGVLDGRPLFVCKYWMAGDHWQIVRTGKDGSDVYGKAESLPVGKAPKAVIRTALKAAGLIGDGLYGVDLKMVDGHVYVMEVNDNPNIDNGVEDEILGEELYLRLMEVFLRRVENKKALGASL